MNHVLRISSTPLNAGGRGLRAWRWCSCCGRERGAGYTCEGCGAPSVLVKAPDLPGYLPLSLEWWRERIASDPEPELVEIHYEGWWPLRPWGSW